MFDLLGGRCFLSGVLSLIHFGDLSHLTMFLLVWFLFCLFVMALGLNFVCGNKLQIPAPLPTWSCCVEYKINTILTSLLCQNVKEERYKFFLTNV